MPVYCSAQSSNTVVLRRVCCLLIVLGLLLAFVPNAFANSATVHLSSAYNYRSVTNNTFVEWSGDLYGDSLHYGLGSDSHINFTDFSLGSASNPSWTFGVVSQNGNITIRSIQTNYIRFSGASQPSKTMVMTFYYASLPAEVDIAQPANVTVAASNYYSTYASWAAAPAPAVYDDAGQNYLMVKSSYPAPVIQIDSATAGGTTSPSQSTHTTSKGTSSSTTAGKSGSSSSKSTSHSNAAQGPAFSIITSPVSERIAAGESLNFTVTVTSTGPSPQPVSLTVSGAPGSLLASLVGVSSGLNFSTTVLVSASSTLQPGTYGIVVTGSSGGVQQSATFVLNAQRAEYHLVVADSPPEGGTTSMLPGNYTINPGTAITLSESPSSGWTFQYWAVNGLDGGSNSTLSIQLTSDTTVDAVFATNQARQNPGVPYSVFIGLRGAPNVTLGIDGSEKEAPTSFVWSGGTRHTISAPAVIPLSNSSQLVFSAWEGSANSTLNSITLIVSGPIDLNAVYVVRYSVHVVLEDSAGRTISPSGVLISGDSSDFALPSSGDLWLGKGTYYLVSANWDGVDLAQVAMYPQFTVSKGTTPTINLPVYDLNVTILDVFGDPLTGATATLTLPNGSTISNETTAEGVVHFPEVPGVDLHVKTQYLGVANAFTLNPSQSPSVSITIALSYPVYGLVALAACTVALGLIVIRYRRVHRNDWELGRDGR